MKRSTIRLLVAVMILVFGVLLYMQVNYISAVYKSRNDQFNESVRKALTQVNRDLEKDEIRHLIGGSLAKPLGYDQKLVAPQRKLDIRPENFKLDQLPLNANDPLSKQDKAKDPFIDLSRLLQSQYANKVLYIHELILEMAINIIKQTEDVSFYDRVNRAQLEEHLNDALSNTGINLPYCYDVVDKNNHTYFSSGKVPTDDAYGVFTQALFLNDDPSKLHFLKVYFPGKRQYISQTMDFLIPSIIFTLILFVIFVYTLVSIFRQKKLAELKSDFINNMTHELKTPVATILLGTQMLKDTDVEKSKEFVDQILNSINNEGKRLHGLIEKVLQLSLFDKNKLVLKNKRLDIQDLVITVASTQSIVAEAKGGEVELDLESTASEINGDEMHLTNVITNLIENAIKYSKPDTPPRIKIGTFNKERQVCIYIQDNGIGIKKEYVGKVFDRFFRVPTGNHHNVKGFGLGLAYVHKMVLDHKGSIKVESVWGEGTKFTLSFPLAKEPDEQ